jgi:hypothetical protein
MSLTIKDNPSPSPLVLQTLSQHLPYSLPTLRRLQFMTTTGGAKTPHSHVLSTFDVSAPGNDFLVAYLDFSLGPNTEMWLYSSLENPLLPSNEVVCEEQVLALLARVRELEEAYLKTAQRAFPGLILAGSLNKKICGLLEERGLVHWTAPLHSKILFRLQDLPLTKELPEGFQWGEIREADIPLVLSRTAIPYKALVIRDYLKRERERLIHCDFVGG